PIRTSNGKKAEVIPVVLGELRGVEAHHPVVLRRERGVLQEPTKRLIPGRGRELQTAWGIRTGSQPGHERVLHPPLEDPTRHDECPGGAVPRYQAGEDLAVGACTVIEARSIQ